MVLKGKRSYNVGILVALLTGGSLLIAGPVIAAAYYWTRPFRKIILELEPRDTGSTITIKTEGKTRDVIIHKIEKALKSE